MLTTSWWSSSDWCFGEFPNESFEIRSWQPCKRSCSRFLIDERPSIEKEIPGRDKARGQAKLIARPRTKTCERGHLGGSSPSQVTEPTVSGAGMNHLPEPGLNSWPSEAWERSIGIFHGSEFLHINLFCCHFPLALWKEDFEKFTGNRVFCWVRAQLIKSL